VGCRAGLNQTPAVQLIASDTDSAIPAQTSYDATITQCRCVRKCAIPVTPEETERPIFLHEGECTLVANVHVVERMFLLCPVALVDETHIHRGHHVCRKAEHGLLGTVLCIKTLDSNNRQTTIEICMKCIVSARKVQEWSSTKSIILRTHNSTVAK
jgi:hypothetical protein